MQKEDLIKETLKFYELPPKLRSKITSIATRRVNELHLSKPDEIYQYLGNLIDKFLIVSPYEERFFTRLNHPRYGDSNTLESELIGTTNFLDRNNEWLKERLKKLVLGQKEQLTILGRPVIQIEPVIKFGRRKYDENFTPLSIYESHPKLFDGKSGTQLFQIDASLYESLRRRGLLQKIIPNKIPPGSSTKISEEKEKKIIEFYQRLKSPTKIAKRLKISRGAVDRCLVERHKIRSLNKRSGNPGYSQVMINDIIECLRKCKKASKVAKCYGISRFTVVKHGRKAEIPILPRGGKIENILKMRKYFPKSL